MTSPATVEPTEGELRAAYERCRTSRRTTWPATYHEAMDHPIFSRLVQLAAKHPPRPHRAQEPRQPTPQRLQQRSKQASLPLPDLAPAHMDRKRAAAGDRDD